MGLTTEEAKKRLEQYGFNELQEHKESHLQRLLSFFWGPIPWMIEIAGILSFVLKKWPDFTMIVLLLVINALLGFIQEFKAANAIDALKQRLALKARVKRDGTWKEVPARELVPGDEVMLALGNIIPADVKLLSGEYLSVDQSALTGESLPVDKAVGDEAYSGTIIKKGEMVAEVTKTGMETFFGKTAQLVSTAETQSHFQQAVMKIGNFLIFTTLGIAAVILLVSIFRIDVFDTEHTTLAQLVIFILVLVIAGIPVALPAVLSTTMAIGASRMAKMKAIVAKLIAIEELAGMDILCSDKTGTLTKNELTVGDVEAMQGHTVQEVLLAGALASNPEGQDAIDTAVLSQVKQENLKGYKLEKFIPFDPVIKRIEATLTGPEGTFKVAKGAPQVIAELSGLTYASIAPAVEGFAKRGFRTLGVAKEIQGKYTFLGIIPLFDPPREDTKETIRTAREMGVSVKMITGDHSAIAKELARTLDLGTNILSADQITSHLDEADGFAEVFPEHKFNIVKELQQEKHICGMTGDGVNDAPALKQADIGIAVSNATDAARAAADLVLTEPGLMVITQAIEEARRIFGRMKSYAMYRISETVRLLLFLFLSMLIFNSHPLTAIMIIVIALLNDIPIMMIAYDHMAIAPKPAKWNMTEVLTISVGLALVGVLSTFGLYWIGDKVWHLAMPERQTLAFMAILCGGNLTIYLTRNTRALWTKPFPEWKFFLATLFSQIVGTLAAVYGLGTTDFVGIGWTFVGWSWLYIALSFFVCMLTKEGLYMILEARSKHHKRFLHATSEPLLPSPRR